MSHAEVSPLTHDIQRRLEASAHPATKQWFELKVSLGSRWRGNKAEALRTNVYAAAADDLRRRHAAGDQSGAGAARYCAAMELIRSCYCDDKLAGMILFQVRLRPSATFRGTKPGHVCSSFPPPFCHERSTSPARRRVYAAARPTGCCILLPLRHANSRSRGNRPTRSPRSLGTCSPNQNSSAAQIFTRLP